MLSQPLGVMLDQMRLALQAAPVDRASLPAEITRDWIAPDGRVPQVFPSGNANDNRVIHRFRDAVAAVTPAISGLPVATQAAASTVAGAFVQAGVIAFLLVSVLLFLVLRDAKEVAFTLAPVVLSIFLTLGSCVVIGQPINFANIIAFPLLFGVGVAFHIYFVMAWRDGATGLLQSSLARAVLFSAFATGTAFGSLWLSHHPGTASMGKILMISLIWTLICALVFEPALLGPPRAKAQPRAKRSAVKAAARASLPDRPADRATRARRTGRRRFGLCAGQFRIVQRIGQFRRGLLGSGRGMPLGFLDLGRAILEIDRTQGGIGIDRAIEQGAQIRVDSARRSSPPMPPVMSWYSIELNGLPATSGRSASSAELPNRSRSAGGR
jgi:hypothetical protein